MSFFLSGGGSPPAVGLEVTNQAAWHANSGTEPKMGKGGDAGPTRGLLGLHSTQPLKTWAGQGPRWRAGTKGKVNGNGQAPNSVWQLQVLGWPFRGGVGGGGGGGALGGHTSEKTNPERVNGLEGWSWGLWSEGSVGCPPLIRPFGQRLYQNGHFRTCHVPQGLKVKGGGRGGGK